MVGLVPVTMACKVVILEQPSDITTGGKLALAQQLLWLVLTVMLAGQVNAGPLSSTTLIRWAFTLGLVALAGKQSFRTLQVRMMV